ncbi:Adenylate cyclase [Nocardioides sp. AX2bis]|nr:Adenylate cyclase [Nocardioides sp. AX2bis]
MTAHPGHALLEQIGAASTAPVVRRLRGEGASVPGASARSAPPRRAAPPMPTEAASVQPVARDQPFRGPHPGRTTR